MPPTSRETARERDAQGRCIVCNELSLVRRRGLCETDYQRYRRAKAKVSASQREEWEEGLIEAGLLLPSRQGRKLSPEEDRFAAYTAEFLATKDQRSPEDAQRLAEELVKDAEQQTKKPRSSRRTRKP